MYINLAVILRVTEIEPTYFTFGKRKSTVNKILTSVFSCVCPVIDHEFCHNIVKVAVDPRGDSRVNPQTTLTMLYKIHCL